LAMASSYRGVWLRDLDTGTAEEIVEEEVDSGECLRYTADGQYLLIATEEGLVVWDVREHRQRRWPYDRSPGGEVAMSGDGERVAVEVSRDKVEVRAALDGSLLRTLRVPKPNEAICAMVLDATGRRLAIAGSGAPLRVWDVDTGRLLHEITADADPMSLSF